MSCRINWDNVRNCFLQKDENRNLGSATFHMIAITLISMSLVDLPWFNIDSYICYPYLTVGEFFSFEYVLKEYDCIDGTVVNIIRIVILLCFMAMLFALIGFFLDLTCPTTSIFKYFRKYAIAEAISILFVISIMTISYYVCILLHNIIDEKNPTDNFTISFGLGYYAVVLAGISESLGLLYNWISFHRSTIDDDEPIIDGFDEVPSEFESPTPPPPYSLLPPPYTP